MLCGNGKLRGVSVRNLKDLSSVVFAQANEVLFCLTEEDEGRKTGGACSPVPLLGGVFVQSLPVVKVEEETPSAAPAGLQCFCKTTGEGGGAKIVQKKCAAASAGTAGKRKLKKEGGCGWVGWGSEVGEELCVYGQSAFLQKAHFWGACREAE